MVLISPSGLALLVKGLDDVLLSRYLAGAAVTLVIYDWILLFQREYQTIWATRWTLPKFLYYFIRLFTIPFLGLAAWDLIDFRPASSKSFCDVWLTLISMPMFLTFSASNWLFTLRLLALYERKRIVIWFMCIFYFFTYAITLSMLVVTLVIYARLGINYNPVAKCCQALQNVPYAGPVFYTPALYELLIVTLTVYRAHRDSILTTPDCMPLLIVLYRDNVIAFLVMLAMRTWVIYIYATQPVTAMHIGTNIYWAVNTILSTRVYLNLVWCIYKPLGSINRDNASDGGSDTMENTVPSSIDKPLPPLIRD